MAAEVRSVLVVDDETIVRDNLMDFFEDEGYNVYGVSDAEQGLEFLRNSSIDACVVDMRLSGMSGNEFIARAMETGDKRVYIIHTGSADYRLPDRLMALGITGDNVFVKPVRDMEILAKALKELHRV